MCEFGDESFIINEQELTKKEALIGYRSWYITNPLNNQEKALKSLNQNYLWVKKGENKGNPLRNNSEGIYNYKYYNYNHYNYNNYKYYKYYNYKYYYICGKSLLYGKVFTYKDGYRSSICIPTHLVILSDKKWFEDSNTKDFANHFNKLISDLAKEYDCEVIDYDDFMVGR
jgi:hypothetical protein